MPRRSKGLEGKPVKVKRSYRRRKKATQQFTYNPEDVHQLTLLRERNALLESRLREYEKAEDSRRHQFNNREAHTPHIYGSQVSVSVERALAKKADDILKSRQSSVEAYVNLTLKGFLNSKCELGLSDTLNFGKYAGENVQHVCNTDLSYMYWLAIEQRSKKFKEEVREHVLNLASNEPDGYWLGDDF